MRGAFAEHASQVVEQKPDIYAELDSAGQNFECTKRPLIMNLWVCWLLYGKSLFTAKVDCLCDLAMQMHELLEHEADFSALHQPQSNIVCFRYLPQNLLTMDMGGFQLAIWERIRKEGEFFISRVDVDEQIALRVVFMNHEITLEHMQALLKEIRHVGQKILNIFHFD